jgi:hypothetical protein
MIAVVVNARMRCVAPPRATPGIFSSLLSSMPEDDEGGS